MKNKQLGFTLIELMISLALGLIVVAAAILLFLTGQKSVAMQKGVAELQDNANFGLNYITKDIRLTNLNVKSATINDQSPYGGVVLSSSNTETNTNVYLSAAALDVSLMSKGDLTSNVVDGSGAAVNSDQLVIQYLPQYTLDNKNTLSDESDDELVGGFDCEGQELRFSKSAGLQMVVQRYFLRADSNKANNEGSPLALACDAGYYSISTPSSIQGYGGSGEIIMKRVDHFRVLLGVQYANGTHRYLPIASYMALTAPRPRILSIQLGALARSTQSMGGDALIKADQTFQVLDQTVKLKAMTDPKYIRQVVSQTIALRNALGERE
ncbi:PilW family protein [Acinetobacter sp. GXMZU3951]